MASMLLITIWTVASAGITAAAALYLLQPKLPQFIKDLLLYGKAKGKPKTRTFVEIIEIPKRWFLHFYMVGSIVNGFALYFVCSAYLLGQRPPGLMLTTLSMVSPATSQVTTSAASAILVIGMMFFQNMRRLLECLFVSVYSKGKMNVVHYMLGWGLYSTFHIAVLCEAPSVLTARIHDARADFLQWRHLVGVALFLWASWHHNRVHEAFADLRKNKDGTVVSYEHRLPSGGWFEYVSCPHYFMEIIIYLAFITVVGVSHWTMWSIVLFVTSNQVCAALISHKWYKDTFKDKFPANRKAVIPFLV